MDFILSEIFVYPIKSASGVYLQEAKVGEKGLELDRRWMLVDQKGKFISQRTHPELSLVSVNIENEGLVVKHKYENYDKLFVPLDIDEEYTRDVDIWNDKCAAILVSDAADCWFSKILGIQCQLVYMPDNSIRFVDPKYSLGDKTVGFADGFPFLLIGQSSLDDLNSRLENRISINRFRPNLVFTGGEPFIEDTWKEFKIGAVTFFPVKPCARCTVPTVNQEIGKRGNEPLATLSSYRVENNKIFFGQNLVHEGRGIIKVNDPLKIIE